MMLLFFHVREPLTSAAGLFFFSQIHNLILLCNCYLMFDNNIIVYGNVG